MQRSALRIILAMALALGAGAVKAQDIAIAVGGPITGSNAALGEQTTRAAKTADADLNAKGGTTCSERAAATTCRAGSPASISPNDSRGKTWPSSTTRLPTAKGSPTRPRRR